MPLRSDAAGISLLSTASYVLNTTGAGVCAAKTHARGLQEPVNIKSRVLAEFCCCVLLGRCGGTGTRP